MSLLPHSLREINRLPQEEKEAIYALLLPDWLYTDFQIDKNTFTLDGSRIVHFYCPPESRVLEIRVQRESCDRDPIMYLNMADTFNNQLLVLLVVMNDPKAKRFNTDQDINGNRTHFGTTGRNLSAEIGAMEAGLAPGQIRGGLRSFKRTVPTFESFVSNMGHDMFLIEPLAYHNAIVFEKYGFNYMRGLADMHLIHKEFSEGGELRQRLDGHTPFRHPDAWKTIRSRSWAIHDGILGHPFTGFQMYKRIGHNAGVSTAPNTPF